MPSRPNKRPSDDSGSPSPKRAKTNKKDTPKTTLMPVGERQKAIVGLKDELMLRMLCKDTKTGEEKVLHFRNLPQSQLNWNNVDHVAKINAWRNQIYGRAGMKAKDVTMWLPDEELWFELYYHLSVSMSLVRGMLLPKSREILEAFNETFASVSGGTEDGEQTPGDRHSNAFASKLNRMCLGLKARLVASVWNKSGDSFVPKITLEMLEEFKKMKQDLAAKGVIRESAYNENLAEWNHLFSNLPGDTSPEFKNASNTSVVKEPSQSPTVAQDEPEMDDRQKHRRAFPNASFDEIEAAEALLCLSKWPVKFPPVQGRPGENCNVHSVAGSVANSAEAAYGSNWSFTPADPAPYSLPNLQYPAGNYSPESASSKTSSKESVKTSVEKPVEMSAEIPAAKPFKRTTRNSLKTTADTPEISSSTSMKKFPAKPSKASPKASSRASIKKSTPKPATKPTSRPVKKAYMNTLMRPKSPSEQTPSPASAPHETAFTGPSPYKHVRGLGTDSGPAGGSPHGSQSEAAAEYGEVLRRKNPGAPRYM